ncbi:ABC transporter ATP-binding protein [Saccharospirillum salsuginis]|uniref:ABC transporter domain-containing protein n=1 Tax=Saccharospirillum salsuginis TaxID=418750 RepID=A0A918KK15_9GAMM|nr:ATP-binding cassette domain-containing protein [Saccharospirillum salsuginis]GGX66204.1 hypothetical protein GCM10007392_37320 [Saccharospirillum salsuginis]
MTVFNTEPAMRLHRVGFRYGLQTVLDNIDLALFAGERLALVGPSGCGKTTLLHLVAGLLSPWEGQCEHRFQRIRMVFQQPRLLPWQTTLNNLTFGLRALGIDPRARQAAGRSMAERFGLHADDLAKYPDQLSGGMQSRVALGRALIVEPDLLLMDEPFSALDIGHKARLYDDLVRLTETRTSMMMITHDLLEAVRLADRILVMAPSPGRIVAEIRLGLAAALRDDLYVHHNGAALMQNPTVRSAFNLPSSTAVSVSSHTETDVLITPVDSMNANPTPNAGVTGC